MDAALSVDIKELRKDFGSFTAVNNINLRVHRGEIFGFLGPNGAGKSTTIRMLCGILQPTSGSGTVAGYDIFSNPEEIKSHIGYMSQRFSLYGDLTVDENLTFFCGLYNVSGARAKVKKQWVIEMAGLQENIKTLTSSLSVGIKQRLALGCAVLHDPPILFLDEPTSGVDPLSRRNFWSLIHQISETGTTVFVTTHYMDEADNCHRLAMIFRGSIVAEGSPKTLREDHFNKCLFRISPDNIFNALKTLSDKGHDCGLFGNTLHVYLPKDKGGEEYLEKILQETNINAMEIEPIKPSLEDVFVSLLGDRDLR